MLCTLGLRQAMSITITLWLTLWKAHVRLWILMLMQKWIASTLRYTTVWALVSQILCNTCTYTLICIWTLTGGFICWILKHYLLIPGDDISSDLDLSGCNINTDNQEERKNHTLNSLICFRIFNLITSCSMSKGRYLISMELAGFIHSKSVRVQKISLHCSSKIPLGIVVPTL